MKAVTNKDLTLKRLSKPHMFAECFPELIEGLKAGKVLSWDDGGNSHELSQYHIDYIEKLEKENARFDITVYAVLENTLDISYEDVRMYSYLYVSNEGPDISMAGAGIYYAIADVVNTTWNIQEMGSVLITGSLNGGPRRVG